MQPEDFWLMRKAQAQLSCVSPPKRIWWNSVLTSNIEATVLAIHVNIGYVPSLHWWPQRLRDNCVPQNLGSVLWQACDLRNLLVKCKNGKGPTPQYLSHGSLGSYHYQERQDVTLLTAVRAMELRRERLALRECNCVALQCSHRWFLPPSLYILIDVIDVSEDMSFQVFKVYIACRLRAHFKLEVGRNLYSVLVFSLKIHI